MKKFSSFKKASGRLKSFWFFGCASLALATIAPSMAATITVSPTEQTYVIRSSTTDADTYLNTGATALLGAGIYSGANRGEYSMLRFNLSSIVPENAVITNVTLKLTAAYSYSYSNGETLRFWQMNDANADWVQGSAGNNREGATGAYLNQTSYTSPSVNAGEAWAGGGLFNTGGADLGAEIGSQAFSSITAGTTYSFVLDAAAFNLWLINPEAESAGLVFHLTNNESTPAASRFMYFHSMNASVGPTLLPQLEVTYAIPEPSVAILLLGTGIVGGLLARRRHTSVAA